MEANIIPIHALKDNYIWTFFDEDTRSAWVVDPGEAQPVIDALKKYDLNLSGILITHHHRDHSGGVEELIHHTHPIPVIACHKSSVKQVTQHAREGDDILCGFLQLKALEIPGHTLDHMAFYNNEMLFSGDTLFSAGCGRVFEGTPEMMYQSLSKLLKLPDETKMYCGHEYTLANLMFAQHVEPDNQFIADKIQHVKKLLAQNIPTLPSTLGEEKLMNPFLRCQEKSVIAAAEKQAGKKLQNPVEVFACLREWKNNFYVTK